MKYDIKVTDPRQKPEFSAIVTLRSTIGGRKLHVGGIWDCNKAQALRFTGGNPTSKWILDVKESQIVILEEQSGPNLDATRILYLYDVGKLPPFQIGDTGDGHMDIPRGRISEGYVTWECTNRY